MAKKGRNGGHGRYMEQITFWIMLRNIGLQALINEGHQLHKAIGNGNPMSRWPLEVSQCGVCQQQKPTGIMSAYEVNFSNTNVTKQVSKD